MRSTRPSARRSRASKTCAGGSWPAIRCSRAASTLLPRARAPLRGLYLWGGVGRGKTFLVGRVLRRAADPREAARALPSLHAGRARTAAPGTATAPRRSSRSPRNRREGARSVHRRVRRRRRRGRDDPRHAARGAVPARRDARRHLEPASRRALPGRPAARALPARDRAHREALPGRRDRRRRRLPTAAARAGDALARARRTRTPMRAWRPSSNASPTGAAGAT